VADVHRAGWDRIAVAIEDFGHGSVSAQQDVAAVHRG
jgi:hypothetical protein